MHQGKFDHVCRKGVSVLLVLVCCSGVSFIFSPVLWPASNRCFANMSLNSTSNCSTFDCWLSAKAEFSHSKILSWISRCKGDKIV